MEPGISRKTVDLATDEDVCRDECVGLMVRGMKVPSTQDSHILKHMRCNCCACMNFACNWRQAIKNEFRKRVRDPLAPQRKPHRWMPVLGPCDSPKKASTFGGSSKMFPRLTHNSRRNRRSPRVSWWFGNAASDSECDVLKFEAPRERRNKQSTNCSEGKSHPCSDGFINAAMDGTIGASCLQNPGRRSVHNESVHRLRYSSRGYESPVPKRRRPLIQGIMEDTFKHGIPRVDELGSLNYCSPRARNSRNNLGNNLSQSHEEPKLNGPHTFRRQTNSPFFSDSPIHSVSSRHHNTTANKTSNKYLSAQDIRSHETSRKYLIDNGINNYSDLIYKNSKLSILPQRKENNILTRPIYQRYSDVPDSEWPSSKIPKYSPTIKANDDDPYFWCKNKQTGKQGSLSSPESHGTSKSPQDCDRELSCSNVNVPSRRSSNRHEGDVGCRSVDQHAPHHARNYHDGHQHQRHRGKLRSVSFSNDCVEGGEYKVVGKDKIGFRRSSRTGEERCRFHGDHSRTNYAEGRTEYYSDDVDEKYKRYQRDERSRNYDDNEGRTKYYSDDCDEKQKRYQRDERSRNYDDNQGRTKYYSDDGDEKYKRYHRDEMSRNYDDNEGRTKYYSDDCDEKQKRYHRDERSRNYESDDKSPNYSNEEIRPSYYIDKGRPNYHSGEKHLNHQDDKTHDELYSNKNVHDRHSSTRKRRDNLTNKIVLASSELENRVRFSHKGNTSLDSSKRATEHNKSPSSTKHYTRWTSLSPDKVNAGLGRPCCSPKHFNCVELNEDRQGKVSGSPEALFPRHRHLDADKKFGTSRISSNISSSCPRQKEHQSSQESLKSGHSRNLKDNPSSTKIIRSDLSFSPLDQFVLTTPKYGQNNSSRSRRKSGLPEESHCRLREKDDLQQPTCSGPPEDRDRAQSSIHPSPFEPSVRAIRGTKPNSRPDWLQNHLSLMNDCSFERQKNAKSRMKRIVDKTNALTRSSDNIHMDFSHMFERLDKVKDQQNRYLERVDETVQRMKDRTNAHLDP